MAGKTVLDAVNLMLRSRGQAPVITLGSGSPLAASAQAVLNEVSTEVQMRQWPSNTEYDVELTPDVDDHILVTSDVIAIDGYGVDYWRRFAIRNGRLWNSDLNTDEFDSSVRVRIVRELPYEQLSPALRNYIAFEAAMRFQESSLGSAKLDSFIARGLEQARLEAHREKTQQGNHSIMSNVTTMEITGTAVIPSTVYPRVF